MNIEEEIAQAMYEAPAPDETEHGAWPPAHPEDVEWWMSRAAAVMPLMKRAQASAYDEGYDEHADDIGLSQMMRDMGRSNGNPYIENEGAGA